MAPGSPSPGGSAQGGGTARLRPDSRSGPFWGHPALWSALAAIVLYLAALGHGFVWDDHGLIEQNPLVRGRVPLAGLLLSDFWAGSGVQTAGFWRPLVTLSYRLDFLLFHGQAWGFHATNIAAHAATSAMVALLLGQWGLARPAALVAGLWFALLPAHVESVAWISGRTDVLSTLFLLIALWLDTRARRAGRRWCGAPALAAVALALLGKESALVFIPLAGLAAWVEGSSPGRSLRWLLPALAIGLVYLAVHAWVAPLARALPPPDLASAERGRWATWLEFPGHLAFLWPWTNHAPGPVIALPESFWSAPVVAGVLVEAIAVLGIAVLAASRSRLALPAALLWLPFVPLTVAGLANGRLLFAERFLYLPSVGAAWLLGSGLDALRARAPAGARPGAVRRALAGAARVAAGLLVVGGTVEAARALPAWKDDRALFATMAHERPANPYGHARWARVLAVDGRRAEATAEIAEARRLWPGLPLADLAEAWVELLGGGMDRALSLADRALAADSSLEDARLVRGEALVGLGRPAEGWTTLAPLAERNPGDPVIAAAAGWCALQQGRAAEALPLLERAAVDPVIGGKAEIHFEVGLARSRLGEAAEARLALERAIAIDPAHYGAWLELAAACARLGDDEGRERALARAAALPQSRDGQAEALRRRLEGSAAPPPGRVGEPR